MRWKSYLKSWLIASVFTTLVISCATAGAEGPEVIVVGDDAPPFRMIRNGRASGIYYDTIKELGRRMGFTPVFESVPQKRALIMMESGKADLMPGPNWTLGREQYMIFSKASFPSVNKAFYVKKGHRFITQYSDLYGQLIGVCLGKYYFTQFDADFMLQKDQVYRYEMAFEKVATGRNDVAIAPELQGDFLVLAMRLPLVKSPYLVKGKRCYICVSRMSLFVHRIPELETTMQKMLEDGTMAAIHRRYEAGMN